MGNTIIFTDFDSEDNLNTLARFQPSSYEVVKGHSVTINGKKVTFERFDMSQHQNGMSSGIGAVLTVEHKETSSEIIPTVSANPDGHFEANPVSFPGGGLIMIERINADAGGIVLKYQNSMEILDVKIGANLVVISGADTTETTLVYNSGDPHGTSSTTTLTDGSRLMFVDIHPEHNSVILYLEPSKDTYLATIEISTKPMINLVWFGFLGIVAGAVVAFVKRLSESKKGSE
jgi:hypothetical protein